jgi:predicted alpha/beta hydrolase
VTHESANPASLVHTASFPTANPAAVTLVTEDGYPLAGTRWLAQGDRKGVVLVAPGTGAPRHYYRRFAEFIAERGFDTLCWDWRGIGGSRLDGSLRDSRLSMRAWGEQDLAAAISWAARRCDDGRIALVGHSFGGLALGLAPNAHLVDRAVFIGAQHGWLGHWPWSLRLPLGLLWQLLMPLSARVLGRFPSSWLGLGEDLPGGVARDWAHWSARRAALGTWSGHAALNIPILSLSFEHDRFAPRAAVEALLREYSHALVTHEHQLDDSGDHFGFFRQSSDSLLWTRVATFLEE